MRHTARIGKGPDAIAECALPPGAQVSSFPRDLPAPVLQDFRVHVPVLADIGEPFNSTDVVRNDRPSRRLMFVRHLGTKWVIAYEHGGLGNHDHVVA
jgi:hypothetical protein